MRRTLLRRARATRFAPRLRAAGVGAFASFAILASIVAPARATVMVEIPLDELADQAHAIVHGVVTRVGVRAVARGGAIEATTLVDLRVARWLKGDGGRKVRLHERGGAGSWGGQMIVGTPSYRVGEEVIVFLERRDGRLRTLALSQGRFLVHRNARRGPVLSRDLEDIGFARFDRRGMRIEEGTSQGTLALETLLEVIRDAGDRGAIHVDEPAR